MLRKTKSQPCNSYNHQQIKITKTVSVADNSTQRVKHS